MTMGRTHRGAATPHRTSGARRYRSCHQEEYGYRQSHRFMQTFPYHVGLSLESLRKKHNTTITSCQSDDQTFEATLTKARFTRYPSRMKIETGFSGLSERTIPFLRPT